MGLPLAVLAAVALDVVEPNGAVKFHIRKLEIGLDEPTLPKG
jgi:hypothetical protein